MKILVLNAGSSTQKSALYEFKNDLEDTAKTPLWEAKIDWTKKEGVAVLTVETQHGESLEDELPGGDRIKAISQMLNTLWQGSTQVIAQLTEIDVVGHRVVHGGVQYREATKITPEVKDAIAALFSIAPEHNPINLEGIDAIEQILKNVPQVAVFDTAFHSQMPLEAKIYPIPYQYYQQGIRRYGFHGISHHYCLERVAQLLGKDKKELRIITCHLGNGCSLAAIKNGISINTTMGYTPLEGLMMGSRSGSIDPSIVIELVRKGYEVEDIETLLNEKSGIKGLSGLSGDMRELTQAIEAGNEQAKLTFDVYVHRLRCYIGSMLTSLGGLDVLVFTGGVGEHRSSVRKAACETLGFLGLEIDGKKNDNASQDTDIASEKSSVRVFMIKAQEAWQIAKECWKLFQS